MGLAIVVGTSGELIKIFPIIAEAERTGVPWRVFSTGQSGINFKQQWRDFRLPSEHLTEVIASTEDLKKSGQALRWFAKAASLSRARLRERLGRSEVVLVHGDTLSTLVGALWARRTSLPLAHVEAGLRSNHWLQPFPEEMNRRVVSKLARIHFAPNATAELQLKKSAVSGKVLNTELNTLWDALTSCLSEDAPPLPFKKPFIVANIHRFENLKSDRRWNTVVETLKKASRIAPVHFVLHPSTEQKLNASGDRKGLEECGVIFSPRRPFKEFIRWINESIFLISDGGSNQEECYYLGKPCLLLRETTERDEGLQTSNLLTGLLAEKIDFFLAHHESFARAKLDVRTSPSRRIVEFLAKEFALA